MSELAVVQKETRLAVAQPMEFSSEQIRILAETVAKGCDQNELGFFINVCKMKRLDPFSGQIHVVKRWDKDAGRDKMAIQTGIDGYRVIAARTGELAGIDDPIYDSEEGAFPKWAKVTVHRYGRNNEKIPYTATARWSEYVQTKRDGAPTHNWNTKPFLMLGKCSEALALRKGFPDELSGMYTDEEMGQADNHQPDSKPPVQMPKSTQQASNTAQPVTQQKQATPQTQAAPQTQQASQPAQNEAPQKSQIAGIIEKAKLSEKGDMWLTVDKKVVAVRKDKVNVHIVQGAKIIVEGVAKKFQNGEDFFETHEILTLLAPSDDVQEGEIVEPETSGTTMADAALASEELKGMFSEDPQRQERAAAVQGEVAATKPGTIGKKRAQRLYTIISQSHKNTGFTEAELKRIMAAWPVPFEHLSDMDLGMYEQFEKWATGAEDFNDFWRD